MGNLPQGYGIHKHPEVNQCLERHPRIHWHFTPTEASWLNMVEIFFGIITRQAIRRGTFTSVRGLVQAINSYIKAWNERCEPIAWTKDADAILVKATRQDNLSYGTLDALRTDVVP